MDDEPGIENSFKNPCSLTYIDFEILEKFPFSEVRKYKLYNLKNIKLGHLNVNSVRNMFSFIAELVKIDGSFPSRQFAVDNYKIFRRDRNCFGGGLMFYVNENIPWRELSPGFT